MAEYIDLEELLDRLYEEGEWTQAISNTAYAMPTADVAPVVHGRWEAQKYWKYENKHSIQYHTNRCSLCHCDVSSRLLYNYCPNCGADMRGEQDE